MTPLPTTNTSFPYVTVQAPSHDEEYQKLDHFRSNEPYEYNRLNRSLPERNIQHQTSIPVYSILPGQVSRCNNNTELVTAHINTSSTPTNSTSGYSSLPVTMKGQFIQCYTNRQCHNVYYYFVDSDLSYKFVTDKVASVIPHKWEEFGRAVAITPPKLQEIRDNNPDNDSRTFCDIVHEWQSSRTTRPFTRETLDLVLNSIGERELLNTRESESEL